MESTHLYWARGRRSWVSEGERISLFSLCNYYDNATYRSCNKVGEKLIGLRSTKRKKEKKKEMVDIILYTF